ncbi:MAG: hypothetical protein DSY76_05575 [Bacteroidetes bacterium]|nr:MAG: hypothetical protein DSY76_05575 [Bacteroidota bacterium]
MIFDKLNFANESQFVFHVWNFHPMFLTPSIPKYLFIEFDIEACAILKNNKFTIVNVCFQNKHNSQSRSIGKDSELYKQY